MASDPGRSAISRAGPYRSYGDMAMSNKIAMSNKNLGISLLRKGDNRTCVMLNIYHTLYKM